MNQEIQRFIRSCHEAHHNNSLHQVEAHSFKCKIDYVTFAHQSKKLSFFSVRQCRRLKEVRGGMSFLHVLLLFFP